VRTDELQRFAEGCAHLHESLAGSVLLDTMEPNLKVALSGNGRGQIHVSLSLTPDHLIQRHSFEDEIDQTELAQIIASTRAVLRAFPVIGSSSAR
jgi:hypothetical protein